MPYIIQNNSDLSVILASAIKKELVREMNMPEEVAEIVVNNYNLEEKGLSQMVSEIAKTCKLVWSGEPLF